MVRMPTPMACVEVVHAVTTPRFGPFKLYLMDRCPEIMLMIEAGTKNGEILRGLFCACRYASYSLSIVHRPPMPAPHTAPQRCGSALLKSMPESATACMPAATP